MYTDAEIAMDFLTIFNHFHFLISNLSKHFNSVCFKDNSKVEAFPLVIWWTYIYAGKYDTVESHFIFFTQIPWKHNWKASTPRGNEA